MITMGPHITKKIILLCKRYILGISTMEKNLIDTHKRANQLPSVPLCSTMNE